MSNLPRRNLVLQRIRNKLSSTLFNPNSNTFDLINLLNQILYNALVENQYPDNKIGNQFTIFSIEFSKDKKTFIHIIYKDQPSTIITGIGLEKKRPKIKWLQKILEESGWLAKLNEISEWISEDEVDQQDEEVEQEEGDEEGEEEGDEEGEEEGEEEGDEGEEDEAVMRKKEKKLLLKLMKKYDFRVDKIVNNQKDFETQIQTGIDIFQKMDDREKQIYFFKEMVEFFLFNYDILKLLPKFMKTIGQKINQFVSQGITDMEIYVPYFDGIKEFPVFKNMSDQKLFDLVLDENKFNNLNSLELKLLEKRILLIEKLPKNIQDLFLDLNDDIEDIEISNTTFLDDEIDNVIHPRGEFVPDPPNLDRDDPEYFSQFQRWIIDNDVVINKSYLPENPEEELERKKKFKKELLTNIQKTKGKIIPPNLRKMISELDCNNEVDPITLDEITKKNYLELKWIIVLDETGKIGDCYNKEELIESMRNNRSFGTFPDRNYSYYKEPLKGVWVDENAIKMIPKSKIVQLEFLTTDKIGTRYGISRTHGTEEKIYTFNKIY